MARVRKDIVQVEVQIGGRQAGTTLKELRGQARQLNREIQHMTIGSEEYKKKMAELREVNQRISEHRQELRGVQNEVDNMPKKFDRVKAAIAAAFAVATIVSFAKSIFGLVVSLDGLDRKARTVFGEALPMVQQFARDAAGDLGMTTDEVVKLATATGDLLVPMGFTREEAARMSTQLVGLSGALSEWTDGERSAAEVSEILTKAMLGEREQLKSLGIAISEADVKARLAAKGQEQLTGAMLQQAKAIATQELIMEKSADAQAAFANNSTGLVRSLSRIRAGLGSIAQGIAERFAPAIRSVVGMVESVVGWFRSWVEVPLHEKVERERVELNALVNSLIQVNEKGQEGAEVTAQRDAIIGRLNSKYPSFLQNIEDEATNNDILKKKLAEVNEEYRQRVLILAQQERLEDRQGKSVSILNDQVDRIIAASGGIQSLVEKYGLAIDTSADFADQIAQIDQQLKDQFGTTEDIVLKTEVPAVPELRNYNATMGSLKVIVAEINELQSEYDLITQDVNKEQAIFNDLLNKSGKTLEELTGKKGKDNDATKVQGDTIAALRKKIKGYQDAMDTAVIGSAAYLEAKKNLAVAQERLSSLTGKGTSAVKKATKAQDDHQKAIAAAQAAIENLKVDIIADKFDQQEARLRLQTKRRIESLVGTPEQIQEQTDLLNKAMAASLDEIQKGRDQKEQELQDKRAQDREKAFQDEMASIQLEEDQKMAALNLHFSNLVDAEREREEALFQMKQEALQQRYDALVQNGKAQTEEAKRIQIEMMNNEAEYNRKRLDNFKRTEDLKKAVLNDGFALAKDLIDLGIQLLGKDEEARKKNAGVMKAFAIGQIWVNLAQEVAGYMAHPASTGTLGTVGIIKTAAATIRAFTAQAKIHSQKFQDGGIFRNYLDKGGIPDGPRHAQGGIALVNSLTGQKVGEMEGGEPYMILSRETRRNNGQIIDALLYNSLYRNGAPIFATGGVVGSSVSTPTTTASPGAGQATQQLQEMMGMLVGEIRGLRMDVAMWNRDLQARVSYDDLSDKAEEEALIRKDASIS